MKHEFDETIFHQNLHEGVHLRKLNSSKFHSGYSYKSDLRAKEAIETYKVQMQQY